MRSNTGATRFGKLAASSDSGTATATACGDRDRIDRIRSYGLGVGVLGRVTMPNRCIRL